MRNDVSEVIGNAVASRDIEAGRPAVVERLVRVLVDDHAMDMVGTDEAIARGVEAAVDAFDDDAWSEAVESFVEQVEARIEASANEIATEVLNELVAARAKA